MPHPRAGAERGGQELVADRTGRGELVEVDQHERGLEPRRDLDDRGELMRLGRERPPRRQPAGVAAGLELGAVANELHDIRGLGRDRRRGREQLARGARLQREALLRRARELRRPLAARARRAGGAGDAAMLVPELGRERHDPLGLGAGVAPIAGPRGRDRRVDHGRRQHVELGARRGARGRRIARRPQRPGDHRGRRERRRQAADHHPPGARERPQRTEQITQRGPAGRRIRRQPAHEHAPDGRGDRAARGADRRARDRVVQLGGGRTVERPAPTQRLPCGHAERELIGARVDLAPRDLLGRHVRGGADDHPGHRRRLERHLHASGRRARELGEPEVTDPDATIGADEDVVGLDVTMDEPGGVGGREAFAGRDQRGQDLGPRAITGGQPRAQGRAGDELHRHEGPAIVIADLEHGHHVRVGELGHRECLAAQPIGRPRAVVELDRDNAIELAIMRQVDGPHPARAEHALDLVAVRDDRPGDQRRVDRRRGDRLRERRLERVRRSHGGLREVVLAAVEVRHERRLYRQRLARWLAAVMVARGPRRSSSSGADADHASRASARVSLSLTAPASSTSAGIPAAAAVLVGSTASTTAR